MNKSKFDQTRRAHSGRFRAQVLVVLAALALVGAACQSASITVDNITVLNGNDANEFGPSDNPEETYLAIMTWRVKPGQAGSAQVSALPIMELGTVIPGSSSSVPAAAGEATFPNVSPLTLAGFNAGEVPEVIGTITVAMDADNTSTSSVPDPNSTPQLAALSGLIQAELATHFETINPSNGTTTAMATEINRAVLELLYGSVSVQDHVEATLGTLPLDDLVGVATTTRVPTDAQLSGVFNAIGNSVSDPDNAGSLPPGSAGFTSTVSIDGIWELDFTVTL